MVRAAGPVNDDGLAKGRVITRDYEKVCFGHLKREIVAQQQQLETILNQRLMDAWSERIASARAEMGRKAWCDKTESLARELGMTVEPDLPAAPGQDFVIAYSGPTDHIVDIFPEQYPTEKACNYARLVGKYQILPPHQTKCITTQYACDYARRVKPYEKIKRYARMSKSSHENEYPTTAIGSSPIVSTALLCRCRRVMRRSLHH
jgi:hypothetical protein